MERTIEITKNEFFDILADALILYENSLQFGGRLEEVFSRSCFLSVNYALEAAANAFLKSVKINGDLSDKIEKFQTIEKFDFVLQWHTDRGLPKGIKVSQDIREIIKERNNIVHPKVSTKSHNVKSNFDTDGKFGAFHTEVGEGTNGKVFNSCSDMALDSIKKLVNFLNEYIFKLWGINLEDVSLLLLPVWHMHPIRPMYERESLQTILKYKSSLNILFLDFDEIERQFKEVL